MTTLALLARTATCSRLSLFSIVCVLTLLHYSAALSHHEAIFGPQSSLVFSAPGYLSSQVFSRNIGAPGNKIQETTGVLSGGYSPFPDIPLSLNVIQPFSYIKNIDQGTSQTGMEDIIVGSRYRYDITTLQQRFDREGNFLMAMGAIELPTGTIDHKAFNGPLDAMFALAGSIERGPFSLITYGFYRYNGTGKGSKPGDNLILGAGVAWTPLDDAPAGRLLSFQLGLSHESYFRDREAGLLQDRTGGWGFLAHPTIVWGPSKDWLLFGLVTIPISQQYRARAQDEHWRVGFGATYLFGG